MEVMENHMIKPEKRPCPTCLGSKVQKEAHDCPACGGSGYLFNYDKCDCCLGRGEVELEEITCLDCEGLGWYYIG